MEKVVREGMVAVLISPGFGAGWFSWNDNPALLFDPDLVAALEARDHDRILARAKEIEPHGYWGGSRDLKIEWVPEGTVFQVDEYDGSESLSLRDTEDWHVA